jgi:hypothetical protein
MMDCSSEADSRAALGSYKGGKKPWIHQSPKKHSYRCWVILVVEKENIIKRSHKGRETLTVLSVIWSSGPSFTVSINICLSVCIHFSQRLPSNTPQLVFLLLRSSRNLYYKYRILGMSKFDRREITCGVYYLLKRSQNRTQFYFKIKWLYECYDLIKYF